MSSRRWRFVNNNGPQRASRRQHRPACASVRVAPCFHVWYRDQGELHPSIAALDKVQPGLLNLNCGSGIGDTAAVTTARVQVATRVRPTTSRT